MNGVRYNAVATWLGNYFFEHDIVGENTHQLPKVGHLQFRTTRLSDGEGVSNALVTAEVHGGPYVCVQRKDLIGKCVIKLLPGTPQTEDEMKLLLYVTKANQLPGMAFDPHLYDLDFEARGRMIHSDRFSFVPDRHMAAAIKKKKKQTLHVGATQCPFIIETTALKEDYPNY